MFIGRFPFSIWVTSTSDVWQDLGKHVIIVGGKELSYALTVTRVTSNATAIPATALIVARPDVLFGVNAASGSYATAAGTTHHATDLSGVTDKLMGQPGILAKLASGSTAGYVVGYLDVILRACATMIGSRAIEVDPNLTTAAPRKYLLGRVPASGADKLRAAIVSNAVNDVDYLFYVRGVNDPDAPGSWVAIGAWTALTNGADAICTTDASVSGVTPASYQYLEYALALRNKTAGTTPAGFLRVTAGQSHS